jgi:uncharacterized protein YjbI with pentapeptide repeats
MILIDKIKLMVAIIAIMALGQSCTLFSSDCGCKQAVNIPGDTTGMLPLKTSMITEEIKQVVYQPTFLPDGSKRPKATLNSHKSGEDFRFLQLDNVKWPDAEIAYADFRGVSFRSGDCRGSSFENCDFRLADLRWTSFDKATLINNNFAQAVLFRTRMNDAVVEHSDFRGCNLFGLRANRASFQYSDFSNSLMKEIEAMDANFSRSKAVKVQFHIAVLAGSKFDNGDLCFADFTGAGLEQASFANACLQGASFRGATLHQTDFSGADLKDANFFGAKMAETNFTGAKNIPGHLKEIIKNGFATGIVVHHNNPV